MIDVRDLGFRHSLAAPWLFSGLSFSLQQGKTLALLGRNGNGKTTLLKCLAGLLAPGAGSVRCSGAIGYVPQSFTPAFGYSVFDVVLMGRARHVGLFSKPTAIDRQQARGALDLIGLGSLSQRSVTTLSGGERQLVLIARALASEANILLLDEPASALDFHNQALMLSTLRRLTLQRGLTIVMTTHEPTHALEIADRVVLLHGSGSGEEGPVETMCTERKLSDLYGISMKRLDYCASKGPSAHIVANYSSIAGL
ncbi:ABC transporter ATP-binding protein [Aestuariivirga sp.]|uniref:ABC transporter ATP-binding protein n=1 Tax=Aestuariivirga sp. TaxID=2650926 RepID=UPI003BA8EE2F